MLDGVIMLHRKKGLISILRFVLPPEAMVDTFA